MKEIFIIIYLIIPLISFVFGLMESLEQQTRHREYGIGYYIKIRRVGVFMIPPALVQLIPMLLFDISDSYVWKCFVIILAVVLLAVLVPRNFRVGIYSTKELIPEYTKKYELICLKVFSYFMLSYMAFKLVVSKWFG